MRLPFTARLAALVVGAAAVLAGSGWLGLRDLDRAFPLPTAISVSAEVRDRNGALLRAFAAPDKRWRLATDTAAVDPAFVRMLIAYEDKRFFEHGGVDLLALARAAGQFVTHGRIVSGGSTLSMQLARLIEPRTERSLWTKARQIFRAVQIERQWSKAEILTRYLTIAPYGGNLEGVRAASLAWLGKEPKRLTTAKHITTHPSSPTPAGRTAPRRKRRRRATVCSIAWSRPASSAHRKRNAPQPKRFRPCGLPSRPLPPMSRKPPCAMARPARS